LRVLLAGVSTRAAAESAARAGFAVTAIDAFADADQHPAVHAQALRGRFSADAAALLARTISCDAVAYGSSFENHPRAVDLLAAGRRLWGNASDVIRRVRDPTLLSRALRQRGLPAPAVANNESQASNPKSQSEWLLKPRASGGGRRVRRWRHGMRLPPACYLQELIDGTPGSVAFVAARGRVVPIGFCRQLIGEESFGASGFRYCGNILTAAGDDDDAVDAVCALAGAVGEEFGLVGVNGVDIIIQTGVPYAIEANPRWCASMELIERAYGLSVFGVHAAACRDGELADFDLARARRATQAVGKAIVFARRDVMIGDLRTRLPDSAGAGDLRDIPNPGTPIRSGRPVCTVFAAGCDAAACRDQLTRRAAAVYASLDAML
jgi:uncharacterized protein